MVGSRLLLLNSTFMYVSSDDAWCVKYGSNRLGKLERCFMQALLSFWAEATTNWNILGFRESYGLLISTLHSESGSWRNLLEWLVSSKPFAPWHIPISWSQPVDGKGRGQGPLRHELRVRRHRPQVLEVLWFHFSRISNGIGIIWNRFYAWNHNRYPSVVTVGGSAFNLDHAPTGELSSLRIPSGHKHEFRVTPLVGEVVFRWVRYYVLNYTHFDV